MTTEQRIVDILQTHWDIMKMLFNLLRDKYDTNACEQNDDLATIEYRIGMYRHKANAEVSRNG